MKSKVLPTNDDAAKKNPPITISDIIYPAIFIILLVAIGFFIWKFIAPIAAIIVGALISYIYMIRNIFKDKQEK